MLVTHHLQKTNVLLDPLLNPDRDIELYNFGTLGKFAVEISAEGPGTTRSTCRS